jgi:hypothetical protein
MSRNPESLVNRSVKVGLGAFLGLTSIHATLKSTDTEKVSSPAAYSQQANPKNFDTLVSEVEGLKGLRWVKGTGYMSTWEKAESDLRNKDVVVVSLKSSEPISSQQPNPNKVTDINIERFPEGTKISPIMDPAKSPVPKLSETFTPNVPLFGNTAKNTLNTWSQYIEINKPTYYFPPNPNSTYLVDVNGGIIVTETGDSDKKIIHNKTEANVVMEGLQNQFYDLAEAANFHTNDKTLPILVK